jgi:hypothetical protein
VARAIVTLRQAYDGPADGSKAEISDAISDTAKDDQADGGHATGP